MINRYYTHPPKIYKPFKGDSQAHKVYHMERSIVGWCVNTHTPLEDMEVVAAHACRKYKVKAPEIKIISKKKKPFGWTCHKIYLNKLWHGDNMAVMLHELAHWIHDELDIGGEAHGPEFMGIYIELLDKYKMMPRLLMQLLCASYEVEYG